MKLIDLSQNENYFGFTPKILQVIKSIKETNLITYQRKSDFREQLCNLHKVNLNNIFIENGAVGALREVFVNLASLDNKSLLIADISWDYLRQLASQHNLKVGEYIINEANNADTFSFNIKDILERCTEFKPAAIIINSPHNPAGNILSENQLIYLLEQIDKKVLIILDETYFSFSNTIKDNRGSIIKKYPNVVVIRSFSKYYALAGIRLGYLLIGNYACKKLNIYAPYLENSYISEKIGSIALNSTKYYKSINNKLTQQKKILYYFCKNIDGFHPYHTVANFILVKIDPKKYQHTEYAKFMENNGYKIKVFLEGKLNNCVRITIAPNKITKKIIALTKFFISNKI